MIVKKIHFVALLLLACLPSCLYGAEKKVAFLGGKCHLLRVELVDKQGSDYSLAHPEAFLSPKALARRQRQGLPLDSTDLPISATYEQAVTACGVSVVCRSKWNNTLVVRSDYSETALRLRQLPCVRNVDLVYSSPDSLVVAERDSLADVSDYCVEVDPDTLQGEAYYGLAAQQITALGGDRLHQAGYRGEGMTIAVIDGGFMNADCLPLLHHVNVIESHDCAFPPANIFTETYHGTAVLSTMAANIPGQFVGTAPAAAYMLLRSEVSQTESRAEEDFWAAAAEYADSAGVDVINTSLGYHHFDSPEADYKYIDLDGHATLISRTASMLAAKGLVLVCSAGNDGDDPWKKITMPADADNSLCVGAINEKGVNTNFSSVGPAADGRVKPDVMARGFHTTVLNGHGDIAYLNGTSFASPVMCGLVACFWQAHPDKTAAQIVEMVRQLGHQYETPDNIFGYGIPNFAKGL